MYICIYVYMYICIYVSMYFMYVGLYVCMYVYIYMYIYIYVLYIYSVYCLYTIYTLYITYSYSIYYTYVHTHTLYNIICCCSGYCAPSSTPRLHCGRLALGGGSSGGLWQETFAVGQLQFSLVGDLDDIGMLAGSGWGQGRKT